MNTRMSGALRRAGGRDPSDPVDEPVDARRRWRTTLAGVVVATMALGGMTALAATPAAADEAAVAEQSETVVAEPAAAEPAAAEPAAAEPAAEEPVAEEPAAEPAAPPADEAEAPAEEPAAPAEEPAVPAEEPVEAPAAEGETAPGPAPPGEEAAAADVAALLVPPGEEVVDKVEICHATASYRNPYVINEPAADGDVQGHAGHTGPVFYPEIPKGTEWGDIIPPFYYDDGGEEPAYFGGLNWDAEGQAIYENDCVAPEVPDPTFEYWVESCVDDEGRGNVEFELGNLVSGLDYRVDLYTSGGSGVEWWLITDTEGTFEGSYVLPPGDYYFEIWVYNDDSEEWELFDTVDFTVDPCPLDVDAVATGCSLGTDGTALVSLSGLVEGEDYEWLLSGDDYFLEGTLEDVDGGSLDVPFGDLPPGNYVFAIVWAEDTSIHAEAEFFVEPCEPGITVVVTECPAYGGEGSALLKLSNLVEGVEYDVWVTAKGDMDGTVYDGIRTITGGASHTAEIEISPLAAGEDYTAWVHGTWTIPEFVEQPEPIEEFELHASVDFSLKPCPPAPVTPAKVKPAGLATTGTDDTGGLATAALILLGLGGAALVAQGRRQAHSRVKE